MDICYDEVQAWTTYTKLKLNDQRTEAILFGPTARGKQSEITVFTVGSWKNIGDILDNELSMDNHATTQINVLVSLETLAPFTSF